MKTFSGQNSSQLQVDSSHFILSPVSGEARLTRVCGSIPLRARSQPRLALDVELPEICLSLSKNQYNQLLALGSEAARWETRRQHRFGRPAETIQEK